ncbi:MAG: TetR family transcriptional regulator [Nocardioides sp.]|uniref:TetR/AcrR family transcriptional regulator n=1 Tax=Nocardioides sp. TaxID=35761 RepID=UPI0039E269C4
MSFEGTHQGADAPVSLRERTREAIRSEVVETAWRLFAEQGFAGTTVDQIVESAGMSRRTFFRYFSGKEELVTWRLLASGAAVRRELLERPSTESDWVALRRAFDCVVTDVEQNAEIARRLHGLLLDEPEVRTAFHERAFRWADLLGPVLAARRGSVPKDSAAEGVERLRARALVASALACFDAAQLSWALDGSDPALGPLVDEAMTAVAPLA